MHGESRCGDLHDIRLRRGNSHGVQGGASAPVDLCRDGCKYTMGAAETLIPALFLDLEVLGVNIIEETRVLDVELIRRYTDDGSFETLATAHIPMVHDKTVEKGGRCYNSRNKHTVNIMQLADFAGVVSIADNLVVGLVPGCHSGQLGSGELCQRMEEQTVGIQTDHVCDASGDRDCIHREAQRGRARDLVRIRDHGAVS